MFVSRESLGTIPKLYFFNDKELSKGNKSERLVSQFLELSRNPKDNSAYKIFSTMREENNFVSEISVSYSPTYKSKIQITNSDSAYKVLKQMWNANLLNIKEQFCVLYLNNNNEVLGFHCLSTGTITSTTVDLRILFGLACKSLATGIIISHNHPSGKLKPSKTDINLTNKIKSAGEMIDVKLLDHIIITNKDYVSLSNEKLI